MNYTEILTSVKKDESTQRFLESIIDNSKFKGLLIVKPIGDHYSIQGDLSKVTRDEVFKYFTTESGGSYLGHFILK